MASRYNRYGRKAFATSTKTRWGHKHRFSLYKEITNAVQLHKEKNVYLEVIYSSMFVCLCPCAYKATRIQSWEL